MIRTVHLHGALGKTFGKKHKLTFDSPRQALRALCLLKPGFQVALRKPDAYFKVMRGSDVIGEEALALGMGKQTDLHITPATKVAGIETILIIGVGLAVAAVVAVSFLPTIQPPDASTRENDRNGSFLFDGAVNVTEQGHPYPLVYGQMEVGSVVASAALDNVDLNAYNSWTTGSGAGSGGGGSTRGLFGGLDWVLQKGGKGGGSSRSAQEEPNSLRSSATAKVVDIICGGQIEGLVAPGLQSVYFDGSPVENSDGSFNAQGVRVETRYGLPDQPYMNGFTDASNPVNQGGTEIRADQAGPIHTITDDSVDRARVTLRLNQFYKQDTENGDIGRTSAGIRIELQSNGGGFTTVLNHTFNGKTNAAYAKDFMVELQGEAPWDLKITRTTPDSSVASVQDAIFFDTVTEIRDVKLVRPNVAYMGVSVDAKQFGSNIPTRSYEVKGLIVQVPTNYDPATRVYTDPENWDGTFKWAWTDNPAWVYHDLLTNDRYGLGKKLRGASIDIYGLYAIARYCDGLVPDGLGGTEPRYTFNAVINKRREAYDVLSSIAATFRGMSFWSSGSIMVTQDRPSDPVQLVNQTNVIGGKFRYEGQSLDEQYSAFVVAWNDPVDGYRVAYEVIEDDDLMRSIGWREKEVVAYGCTSQSQARRVGLWLRDDQIHAREKVRYSAKLDHAQLLPGEKIELEDPHFNLTNRSGRVVQTNSLTSIELDREVDVSSGTWTFTVMTPDGEPQASVVSASVDADGHSTLALQTALTLSPQAGAVWNLKSSTVTSRQFRVLSVREDEEGVYEIFGISYDPNSHARVEQGVHIEATPYSDIPTGPLETPGGLSAIEYFATEGTAVVPSVRLGWAPAVDPRVVGYDVQVRRPGAEDFEALADAGTTALSRTVENVTAGDYSFRVRAIDARERRSAWRQLNQTLIGETAPLPEVTITKFKSDDALQASIRWNRPSDVRPLRYEVFFNVTNDLGTASSKGLQDSEEFTVNDIGFYWVKTAFMSVRSSGSAAQPILNADLPQVSYSSVNGAPQSLQDLDPSANQQLLTVRTDFDDRVTAVDATITQTILDFQAADTLLQTNINSANSAIVTANGLINGLTALTTTQGSRLSTVETQTADHGSRLITVETVASDAQSRVGTLETTTSDQGLRLTSVETSNANVRIGQNLLRNTRFLENSTWAFTATADFGSNWSVAYWTNGAFNLPNERALYVVQSDSNTAGFVDGCSEIIQIEAGRYYSASVYSGAHRCEVQIRIQWLDLNGASLGLSAPFGAEGINDYEAAGGARLTNWKRIWTLGLAPANATQARVHLRRLGTKSGQANSYMFLSRPQFALGNENQTEPGPWSEGSIESVAAALSSSVFTLETTTLDQGQRLSAVETESADSQSRVGTLETTTASQGSRLSTVETESADSQSRVGTLETTTASQGNRLTSVETSSANARVGANLLSNTRLTSSVAPWTTTAHAGHSANWNVSLYSSTTWALPDETSYFLYQSDNSTTGYIDIRSERLPIQAGVFYQASIYSGAHRCHIELRIEWLNASNAVVGYTAPGSTGLNSVEQQSGNTLGSWKRLWITGQAPIGASKARVHFRKLPTLAGNANSALFFIRPQFSEAAENQTAPGPWSEGSLENEFSGLSSSVSTLETTTLDQGSRLALVETESSNSQSRVGTLETTSLTQQGEIGNLQTTATANSLAIVNASVGTNLLKNTRFLQNSQWTTSATGAFGTSWNLAYWTSGAFNLPGERALYIIQPTANPDGFLDLRSEQIQVEAGMAYVASAYTGAHRCNVELYIEWVDSNGATVGFASAPATAFNSYEALGGATLASWKRIWVAGVAPAGAVKASLMLRRYGTLTSSNSYMFVTRPQFSEGTAGQTEPGPWSEGSFESEVSENASAIATNSGRLQAHWSVGTAVPGAEAFIRAQADLTPGGAAASAVAIGADVFSVYVPTGAEWKNALEVSGNQIRANVTLQAGAGIFVGPSNALWQVALRSEFFYEADGAAIDFGFDIGDYDVVFATEGLDTLLAGETYVLRAINKTGTGFTADLKITTADTPTTVTANTNATSPSGPDHMVAKADSSAASNDIYKFYASGSMSITAFDEGGFGGGGGFIDYFGGMSVRLWFHDGTSWTDAGTFYLSYQQVGINPTHNNGNQTYTFTNKLIRSKNWTGAIRSSAALGCFGAEEDGGNGLTDLNKVTYQKAGSSGTRSATPNGELATIQVIPK